MDRRSYCLFDDLSRDTFGKHKGSAADGCTYCYCRVFSSGRRRAPSSLMANQELLMSMLPKTYDRCQGCRADRIETWTGDDAEIYRREAAIEPDGSVVWRECEFDGWGNVLGG